MSHARLGAAADVRPAARRRRLLLVLVAGVVLGLAGVAAVLATRSSPAPGEAAAPAAPRFVEEAAAAGIEHRYDGEFSYFVGGGVAAFDCDDDGRQDLYLAGGTEPAALYRNESAVAGPLRFTRLSDPATDLEQVTGAYPLDVDSDGAIDLAVLRLGPDVLLRGLGDCRFESATDALGLAPDDGWTAAFSATWEGDATLPTLAFGNYLELGPEGERTFDCDDNVLYRPDATGERYGAPLPLSPGWCTLSLLFSDWDLSGRRDLRVSNDRHYYRDGEEQLWRMGEGSPPRLWTHEEGWRTVRIWGMGIATYDLTGDGYPEVYLTSQADNKLQTLTDGSERPTYGDMALRSGVTAHRPHIGDATLPSTAWHPEFADVNNDGLVDLYVTKGNVDAQVEYAAHDPNNLLIGQPDGTFVEAAVEAGLASVERTRGAAVVDLNLDGLPDVVAVNRRENVQLWRNVGNGDAGAPAAMGNWIALRLEQPAPNVDAVGAWVEVRFGDRTARREVTVGGGHAGGQLGWIHFGIGDLERAEVSVVWPDGERGPWLTVEANRFATIERGASEAEPWDPG